MWNLICRIWEFYSKSLEMFSKYYEKNISFKNPSCNVITYQERVCILAYLFYLFFG